MGLLTSKDSDGNVDFSADFHFPTSNKALIIFTRTPELGKCKTRLAATIGDKPALEIYKYLLRHTAEVTSSIMVDKFVYYAGDVVSNDSWDNMTFSKKKQADGDLGIKMREAFFELFELGYKKVMIIGSDLFDLGPQEIDEAFKNLNDHEVVIGPAEDGGYYLLGMKSLNESIFLNKDWGTNTVLNETLKDLEHRSICQMAVKNDIDVFEDIREIEEFQKYIPSALKNKVSK